MGETHDIVQNTYEFSEQTYALKAIDIQFLPPTSRHLIHVQAPSNGAGKRISKKW